jgi:hypothetical protein
VLTLSPQGSDSLVVLAGRWVFGFCVPHLCSRYRLGLRSPGQPVRPRDAFTNGTYTNEFDLSTGHTDTDDVL